VGRFGISIDSCSLGPLTLPRPACKDESRGQSEMARILAKTGQLNLTSFDPAEGDLVLQSWPDPMFA
jgi:hypothetical protein